MSDLLEQARMWEAIGHAKATLNFIRRRLEARQERGKIYAYEVDEMLGEVDIALARIKREGF